MSGPYPGHRSALTPRRHRIERDVRPGQTSSATATERSLILGVRLPSVSSLGRTAQQAARVCLFCLLAAAALSACDNGAQPTATLTPELTATPTSTLTPTPTPTMAAPSPPVDGGSRSAADYTEAEIAEIAAALNRESLDAINSHPKPDLARAKATYSTACQPDDEVEFAAQVDGLLDLFRTGELSVDVVAATRLPGHDDAAIVLAFPLLDDERTSGATRSLIVPEAS